MAKIINQEQKVAQNHPVAFPIYAVGALMLVVILFLLWLLYQSNHRADQLQKQNNESQSKLQQYEDSQGQQLEENLEDM